MKLIIFTCMKFLAAFVLSLSLLVSSSFAVSLTPPLVLKMQEDRSMAASEDIVKQDNNLVKNVVGISLIPLIASGLIFMIVGFSTLNDEDFNSGIAIGGGAGLVGLGALGIWWAF